MGWSSNQVANTGWNWSYVQFEAGSRSRAMLKYYNDTGKPVNISSCFLYMGAGVSGDSDFGGYWAATTTYTAYATFTDSNGTSHTSDTITINNAISSYSGTVKKTFTFNSASYVAAGATVTISITFVTTAMTVVICRNRSDSSTYGGSVRDPGAVRIYTSSGWKMAIPYVYSGGWKQAIPYVYSGGWKISS